MSSEFSFVVEILVPEGGLGRRLDEMYAFHRQRGITDHHMPRRRDAKHDFIRWGFKDVATAEAFAARFQVRWWALSGNDRQKKLFQNGKRR
jgi:hypothetical protein